MNVLMTTAVMQRVRYTCRCGNRVVAYTVRSNGKVSLRRMSRRSEVDTHSDESGPYVDGVGGSRFQPLRRDEAARRRSDARSPTRDATETSRVPSAVSLCIHGYVSRRAPRVCILVRPAERRASTVRALPRRNATQQGLCNCKARVHAYYDRGAPDDPTHVSPA